VTEERDTDVYDGPVVRIAGTLKKSADEGTPRPDLLAKLLSSKKDEELPGGALKPPYAFSELYETYEGSALLRPCVDAYKTNIDGFGQHAEPTVDLKTKAARRKVADALLYERARSESLIAEMEPLGSLESLLSDTDSGALQALPEPTDDETTKLLERLQRRSRLEFSAFQTFFRGCAPGMSFTELRRRTRQDLEVTGNAWWEVVRNKLDEVVQFRYVSPMDMRLLPLDGAFVAIDEYVPITDLSWKKIQVQRQMRRHIKLDDTPIFFKEYGDPRIVSRLSGKIYTDDDALQMAEQEKPKDGEEPKPIPQATEVIHFRIFTPASPYGVPRWIGCAPAVLGSRELDQVNYNYFQNNVVPPLALLCSGGRFGSGVATRIEEYIDEHLKGRKGQHRILVLEAMGQRTPGQSGPASIPKLQFVPLRDVQQQDALFQNYDAQNETKVSKNFRLPQLLRGGDANINKATGWASLRFAEEQVFQPERQAFDDFLNRQLLPTLGIGCWKFVSNAPVTRDPERMVLMVQALVKCGLLLPNEGRELLEDIFNKPFPELDETWAMRPLPIVLAEMKIGLYNGPGGVDVGDDEARQLGGGSDDAGTPRLEETTQPEAPTATSALQNTAARTGAGRPKAPLGATASLNARHTGTEDD